MFKTDRSTESHEAVSASSLPIDALLLQLGTSERGLTSSSAAERRVATGRSALLPTRQLQLVQLFISQFRSPITLVLIAAALLSMFLGQVTDAAIILSIVLIGAVLGVGQEYAAARALTTLLSRVKARVTALRDGEPVELMADQLVKGDLLLLSAGSTIPADCRLLEAEDLFVNESSLTGESFPVEKQPGQLPTGLPMMERKNMLFQGSHVISGTARAVVVCVGTETELGRISHRLRFRASETDFERGVRRYGYYLLEVTLLLVMSIFVMHLAMRHAGLDSLLFALALAVGLTPQLLPAVVSVNLAQGARKLAASQVIVKRLACIENFGSMNVLCCDKTGTLTEGVVQVEQCLDAWGVHHGEALRLAALNAALESGFANPIDEALRRQVAPDIDLVEKLDEIPYDFLRRRLSVLVREGSRKRLIVKGAFNPILAICSDVESAAHEHLPLDQVKESIEQRYEELGRQGYRVIAVAYRDVEHDRVTHEDEAGLTFGALIVLRDPPREGIQRTIESLHQLGVQLKIITGDNRIVAASLAEQVGLNGRTVLTGGELRQMTDEALMRRAVVTKVFAEIEPNQKERIVLALKRAGQVVGYMGDGINDATALHAADVGISVDQAVDVAKEAADIILLEHNLDVLMAGVRQGRATFANTLKYLFLATSANFGNMFSMAGISLFLPFLPLLPKQILLTNLLTDLPEMTIARDHVDAALMDQPQRWNIPLLHRFAIVFGLLSSLFDYATFGVLLWFLQADVETFRTGWFIESIVSACVVVLIVRSRQPFWTSRPAPALIWTTLLVIGVTILLPYTELARPLGFKPLPPVYLGSMLLLVLLYGTAAELVKRWFFSTRPS